MTSALVVVDVGCGNTSSVLHMFRRIGLLAVASSEPRDAAALVLPGVGAWDAVAARLDSSGWSDAVKAHAGAGRPLLGICLGMQLLADRSEEGELPGLSIVPGSVRRLPAGAARVPRVGWRPTHLADGLGSPGGDRFYYSHSFAFSAPSGCDDVVVGTSEHGGVTVASVVRRGTTLGCQFHPERSHRFGMGFLARWAASIGFEAAW